MSDEIVDLLADAVRDLYVSTGQTLVGNAFAARLVALQSRLAALRQPNGEGPVDGCACFDEHPHGTGKQCLCCDMNVPQQPEAPRECPECGHANGHTEIRRMADGITYTECNEVGCYCRTATYRLAMRLADVERERDALRSGAEVARLTASWLTAEAERDAARRDAEDRYTAEEIAAALGATGYMTNAGISHVMEVLHVFRRGNEPPAAKAPEWERVGGEPRNVIRR